MLDEYTGQKFTSGAILETAQPIENEILILLAQRIARFYRDTQRSNMRRVQPPQMVRFLNLQSIMTNHLPQFNIAV